MAHCVWSGEAERVLMKQNGVFIAHCPQSNMNVSSGVAPVSYLLEGQKVGLGSDVAGGGAPVDLPRHDRRHPVLQLRWRLVDQGVPALTLPEALYLATKGGGEFFRQGWAALSRATNSMPLSWTTRPCPPPAPAACPSGWNASSISRTAPLRQIRAGPPAVLSRAVCITHTLPADPVSRATLSAKGGEHHAGIPLRRPASHRGARSR